MRKYRKLGEVAEEYYSNHPEEIEGFLQVTFEEYAKDNDTGALLSALRIISRAKGITTIADETGMTRQGLQKALSVNGNPRLDNINAIMNSLGYRLIPQKLDSAQVKTL